PFTSLRPLPPPPTLFPYTTLFRSPPAGDAALAPGEFSWTPEKSASGPVTILVSEPDKVVYVYRNGVEIGRSSVRTIEIKGLHILDRKSTRLNSSHLGISYAVFCLK